MLSSPFCWLLLLFGLLSFTVLPAWDDTGHLLVADIAQSRLRPDVKAKLDAIARQISFPGAQYDFVTMACWMDDIRTNREDVPMHGRYKPWHYIDIGISPGDPIPSFDPAQLQEESRGNIVQALKRAVAVVRGGTDPLIPDQVVAMSLIVHLVGDIHQPLHCSTYYFPARTFSGKRDTDAGGNRVTITDSAEEPTRMGFRPLNLHAFWDEAYRARFQDGKVFLDEIAYGRGHQDSDADPYKFDVSAYAPGPEVSLNTDFDAWALESNQLAKDYIYGALPFDTSHRACDLSADAVQKASDLARKRIVLAGYRLAKLLNDLLGNAAPGA